MNKYLKKIMSVLIVKVYVSSRGIAPLILKLGTGWR